MPLLPPVISATFPSSLISASLFLIWIIVIILFVALDASPHARDTSISGFFGGTQWAIRRLKKRKLMSVLWQSLRRGSAKRGFPEPLRIEIGNAHVSTPLTKSH